MNVRNLVCLAVLAVAFCSCKKEITGETRETSTLKATIIFGESGKTRAQSTAIPETNWGKIKDLQIFLYDASGIVKFSEKFQPLTPGANGLLIQTWTGVPVGDYTMAIVANAKSSTDSVNTHIGTSAIEWNSMNVRSRVITDLTIHHKPRVFPLAIQNVASNVQSLVAHAEPSEVFVGYNTKGTIKVESGKTTVADPIEIKREVALMRVRLRVNDTTMGFDNRNVKFDQADASIMIYTLPKHMGIAAGNAGGVSNTSVDKNVLVVAEGGTTFKTQDPTSGYGQGTIVDKDYTRWRDIVVFPNNGGRTSSSNTAPVAQRYFVVITGHAPKDHLLSNGDTVKDNNGALVHWSALVADSFNPNMIRELNLNLTSGGQLGVPTQPTQEGGITVTVSEPAPWDVNIKHTDMDI